MIKKQYIVSFLVAMSCFLYSCERKYPRVKIIAPKDGQVFKEGDTNNIEVILKDDGDIILSEELLVTSNLNDTIIKFRASEFTAEYHLTKSFIGESETQYSIEASAVGGHGNRDNEIIGVTSN